MGWTFYNSSGQQLKSAAATPAPVFGRVVRTAGTISTTSTTLVDVTGATVTFTTGAFPVAYGATQTVANSNTGTQITWNVDIDGTLEFGTAGVRHNIATVAEGHNGSFAGQSAALSAASHTIKEQWKTSANTGYIEGGSALNHIFWAHEIR